MTIASAITDILTFALFIWSIAKLWDMLEKDYRSYKSKQINLITIYPSEKMVNIKPIREPIDGEKIKEILANRFNRSMVPPTGEDDPSILWEDTVTMAWFILNNVNPEANNADIYEYDPEKSEDYFLENKIMGCWPMSNNRWKGIWLNIKDITPKQSAYFHKMAQMIPNDPFVISFENGITRIGWL